MFWTGLEAAGDKWEPLDYLTNCEVAIAAFEQATGRSLPRPAPAPAPPPLAAAGAPPSIHPTGFALRFMFCLWKSLQPSSPLFALRQKNQRMPVVGFPKFLASNDRAD